MFWINPPDFLLQRENLSWRQRSLGVGALIFVSVPLTNTSWSCVFLSNKSEKARAKVSLFNMFTAQRSHHELLKAPRPSSPWTYEHCRHVPRGSVGDAGGLRRPGGGGAQPRPRAEVRERPRDARGPPGRRPLHVPRLPVPGQTALHGAIRGKKDLHSICRVPRWVKTSISMEKFVKFCTIWSLNTPI